VLAAGALPLRPRRLQRDALFDSSHDELKQRGCALRVRSDGGTTVLTFKGPAQPGTMKIREEHETVVGDGTALARVLDDLGFHVWFRYEKYREEFTRPGVTIAIDETPIGTFVEIEGDESAILATTAAMGRSESDFIRQSYRSLFTESGSAELTGPDMTFPVR